MKSSKVDSFMKRPRKWHAELEALRAILLDTGLGEDLKWGWPCYAQGDKNVALIHAFKDYCAILFMGGALLKDPKKLLIQQTKNVQSARQLRFTSVAEIDELAKTIRAYVREAAENARAGKKVQLKKTEDFEMPAELASVLASNAKVKAAFVSLTPGRQRAYIYHVSQAKRSETRAARVKKNLPRILAGLGLDD